MKFCPHIKATNTREVSPRRLAAARRALQRQADAVALFPELQPTETPQARCERHDRETVAMVQRWRDAEAANWKRARRMFRALPSETRAQVEVRFWGNRFMPKTAVYLLETIRAVTKEAQP
jgi:hypothetical protein